MKTVVRYLSVVVLLLAFAISCKVGPKREQPVVESPDLYRYDSLSTEADTIVNLRWWEMFNDPVLDTLIRTALDSNRDAKIAAARVAESRAALGFTKADMWPKINYQATYTNGNIIQQQIGLPGTNQNIFAGGSLNWEIDFWGKFRRANEAALADLVSTEFGLRSIQMSLISEVSSSYFLLLDYRERLRVSKNTLELRDSSLQIIQARFDNGIVPEIDLNQAQIQQAIAAAAIPLYERQVAQTEHALSILVGFNPDSVIVGQELKDQIIPNLVPPGLPSILLTRRPDILAAEQDVYAANARVGVAVAQRFPSISLTGMLGAASQDLSTFGAAGAAWSLGGDLLGPLFHFDKNKRRVEIEKARTEQALYAYEKTVLNAFGEVQDALIEIETLHKELDARRNYVIAALNARDLSNARYDKGVTSYLEVLYNEQAAFQAELGYAQTYRQLLSAYIKLYKALGGGWLDEQEEQEANEQQQQNN
ncbi:MAG: efflux transporter outer membrane subunit [Schleiferiaceae bacterium]|jgi:multidrug efflux system outer membrane protein|nr:efflux transporter outer membrane subunit [Schleiferiaceae bacterium]